MNPVEVYISNVTTRTVTIQPRSVICEIQPVSEQEVKEEYKQQSVDILNKITLDENGLSTEEIQQGKHLIQHSQKVTQMSDMLQTYTTK